MEYFGEGSPLSRIDAARTATLLDSMLAAMGRMRRVLLVPPDYTRRHSGAGEIAALLYARLAAAGAEVAVLPALGTHAPMSDAERADMFAGIPPAAFHVHTWRGDLHACGDVPAAFVREASGGLVEFPIRCELNRLLAEGNWDRIISIGQVVPHEVAGIANHHKNVFVGTGGFDAINKTHFLGAVCGMERAMGRADTPVRQVLTYMATRLGAALPVAHVLTVRAHADGEIVTRGLFAGDDEVCLARAAKLCREVNVDLLDVPLDRAVVYLSPGEFQSTWLGNKAIYRLRMAMADGGELIVLAPGVRRFGEDDQIDRLIRRFGYRGTEHTLRMVKEHRELAENLAAAAHLIHGSTEGRFHVTYCPGGLSREETEGVGFGYAPLDAMLRRYDGNRLRQGWNEAASGERFFHVANPGMGLWARRSLFAAGGAGQ